MFTSIKDNIGLIIGIMISAIVWYFIVSTYNNIQDNSKKVMKSEIIKEQNEAWNKRGADEAIETNNEIKEFSSVFQTVKDNELVCDSDGLNCELW